MTMGDYGQFTRVQVWKLENLHAVKNPVPKVWVCGWQGEYGSVDERVWECGWESMGVWMGECGSVVVEGRGDFAKSLGEG